MAATVTWLVTWQCVVETVNPLKYVMSQAHVVPVRKKVIILARRDRTEADLVVWISSMGIYPVQ